MKERLQKVMATNGVCSRRAAEKLIADGKVLVNGNVAQIGDSADESLDKIVVNGVELKKVEEKIYIMLHKPRGYVTTASDEKGRQTVLDLLKNIDTRVYPVGRLDLNSEGLLLLTNDGELTNKLTHPSHEIYKEYLLRIERPDEADPVEKLTRPMIIDGKPIAPPIVKIVRNEDKNVLISVKIREGRNRQIRKMCEECGYKLKTLKRIAEGELKLDRLACGEWRYLTADEIKYLQSI